MEIPPPPYSEIVKTHDALSEKLTYGTYAQLPSSTLFKEMIYRMADGFGSMKTPSAPPESAMNFTKLPSAPPESALSLIKEPSAPLENSPTPMNQPSAAPPNLPSQMKPPSAPVLTPGSTPLPSSAPAAQTNVPQPAMAAQAQQPTLNYSAQPTAQPALVNPNPMGTHVQVPNNPTPPNLPGLPAAPVQNPAVAKPPTPNAEQQNTLGSSKPDPSPNSTEQIASPAPPIAAPQGETAAAQTAHAPSVATVETIPTPSHPEVPGEASSFGPASASTQPVPRPQESMRNEPGAMTSPKENSKEAKAEEGAKEGAMNPSTNSTSSIRYSPPPGETQANAKPNGEPPQQTVLTPLPTPNSPAPETTHQGNMPLPQDTHTHTAPHQTAMGQTAVSTQSNNFSQANPSMPMAQAANIPNTAVATPQLPSQPTSAPVPNTAPANTPTNVPGMPMASGAQPRAISVPGSNSNVIVPYSSATTSSKSNSSSSTGFGSGVNHVESIKKAHDDDEEETEEWEEDDEEEADEDEEE